MKRRIARPALLVASLLLSAAATVSAVPPDASSLPVVIVLRSQQISLDPLHSYSATEAQLYTALYEGLVSYDPRTLEPLPAVAERWKISAGGTHYRFFLRADAAYSNGEPVTAEDVGQSIVRVFK